MLKIVKPNNDKKKGQQRAGHALILHCILNIVFIINLHFYHVNSQGARTVSFLYDFQFHHWELIKRWKKMYGSNSGRSV